MSFIIYYQVHAVTYPGSINPQKALTRSPPGNTPPRSSPPHPSFLPRTDTWVKRSPSLKHNTLLENDFFTLNVSSMHVHISSSRDNSMYLLNRNRQYKFSKAKEFLLYHSNSVYKEA